MCTRVAGLCAQRTGISTARRPWRRARNSNSGSKPKRSMRCCSNRMRQGSRRKALKLHWVSTNGKQTDADNFIENNSGELAEGRLVNFYEAAVKRARTDGNLGLGAGERGEQLVGLFDGRGKV